MVVFKWQNNGMWKGIIEHGRWTNDVGIYAELVVIFRKSRKCFEVVELLFTSIKMQNPGTKIGMAHQRLEAFLSMTFL